MSPLLKGIEGVIQAAATLYGVVGFHRHGADILGRDVAAHANVLRLSVAAGVQRVVFISSSMIYEQCASEPHYEEDGEWPPLPRTDYGLSKLVGERLSKAYWHQYGLPFTIWRPFNVIDPDEAGTDVPGVRHVFADLIHRLVVRQQNPVEILGDGNQVRSFVHIREVAQAIADYSFDPRTLNETYNLGSPETVSVKELAERIFHKARARGFIRDSRPLSFISLPVAATDIRRRVGCFSKAEKELGWRATISLDEALEYCLDSLLIRRDAETTAGQLVANDCSLRLAPSSR